MSNWFHEECVRKGELLDALVEVESIERRRRQAYDKRDRRYTRMFKGRVTVSEVFSEAAHLVRPHGERLLNVPLSPAACDYLVEGEEMFVTMGLRQNTWRLIHIEYLCTPLAERPDFQPELPPI